MGTWCDVGGGALTLHVTKGLLEMGKEAFRATGARSCGGTMEMLWDNLPARCGSARTWALR